MYFGRRVFPIKSFDEGHDHNQDNQSIRMKCYFEYCVYQKDNTCTLDLSGMEINDIGMCEHCEMVTLGEEVLASAKQRRLDKIAEIWADEENA